MTRNIYEIALENLHNDLIRMGTLVEESIDLSIQALTKHDVVLAQAVIDNDDNINDLEQYIEKQCTNLIARQQPIAKDLRNITATLKIITDLERIADHSSDISSLSIDLANSKYIKPLIDIPKMSKMTRKMVDMAINSFINNDIDLAKKVCACDDYIDDLFEKIKNDLVYFIKKDENAINQSIDFLFIAKYLERMADHATNIGEWVVYVETGKHEHLTRLYNKNDFDINPLIEGETNE